jgi:hypothetical protein
MNAGNLMPDAQTNWPQHRYTALDHTDRRGENGTDELGSRSSPATPRDAQFASTPVGPRAAPRPPVTYTRPMCDPFALVLYDPIYRARPHLFSLQGEHPRGPLHHAAACNPEQSPRYSCNAAAGRLLTLVSSCHDTTGFDGLDTIRPLLAQKCP